MTIPAVAGTPPPVPTQTVSNATPSNAPSPVAPQAVIIDAPKVPQTSASHIRPPSSRPNIPPAKVELLPAGDEMSDLLTAATKMLLKSQNTQLNSVLANQSMLRGKIRQLTDEGVSSFKTKIKNDIAAAKKASEAKKWGFIAKCVGLAVAVVVLAAATKVTGGAATPMLVMAVTALIASSAAVASDISEMKGGPAFSATQGLEELGKLIAQDEKWGKLVGGSLAIALAIGMGVATGGVGALVILSDPSIIGMTMEGVAESAELNDDWQMAFRVIGTVAGMVATMYMAGSLGKNASTIASTTAGTAGSGAPVTVTKTAETTMTKVAPKLFTATAQVGQAGVGTVHGVNTMQLADVNYIADQAAIADQQQQAHVNLYSELMGLSPAEARKVLDALAQTQKDYAEMIQAETETYRQIVNSDSPAYG